MTRTKSPSRRHPRGIRAALAVFLLIELPPVNPDRAPVDNWQTSAWMRRAASAQTVMRECPLMIRLEDGTAVEGIADLAFAENTGDGAAWRRLFDARSLS